jgi:uncharacterized linocin/CFP29 family protein
MTVIAQEEHPLTDQEWKDMNSVVIEVARRRLVGRRIIDIYGPLGAGVQTVVHEHFGGTTIGRISLLGEEDADAIRPAHRAAGMIPLIYKDFLIHWRDAELSRQTGAPLDTSLAAAAASFCADAEDDLIFNGNPKMHDAGLATISDRHRLPRSDWAQAGNAFSDVVRAIQTLVQAGFYGPYAMVVNPLLYAQMFQIQPGTGVLEIETTRRLVSDGVHQSALIREGCALVVATGAQNFDLVIGQDLTVAFLGPESLNLPFRVLESVYLRIKRPAAICTMETSPE